MTISLIVDNPKRDLKGLALLGYDLIKAGHEVYLTPMNLQVYEIERLLPDVMLTSGYRKSTYPMYKYFKDLGVGIAVLETEGGFMYNEELLKHRIENHPDSDNVVDLFFCWGEKYKEIVREYATINMNKVYVTGHPRFERLETKIGAKKSRILFAPNFAYLKEGKLNEVLHRQLLKDTGVDIAPNFEGFLAYYLYFLDVVKAVAKAFPGKVVYRPHPFDDLDFLENQLKGADIELDANTALSDTLVETAVCIQNSSATGFEALFNEVPTLIPTGEPSNFRSKEIDEMSEMIADLDDILAYVKRALEGKIEITQDASLAFERVCSTTKNPSLEIKRLLEKQGFSRQTNSLKNSYTSPKLPKKKRVKRFLKDIKRGKISLEGLKYSFYDEWKASGKFFSNEMVMEVLETYRGLAKSNAIIKELKGEFESVRLNDLVG